MAQPAVELAPGVRRVATAPTDLVNSFGLRDDDGQVNLVGAGVRCAPQRLIAGLAWIGAAPQDVTRIVLTHAHGDHAGGSEGLRQRTGLAGVVANEDDAASLRAGQIPEIDRSVLGARVLRRPSGFASVPVSEELREGQLVDAGGGLRCQRPAAVLGDLDHEGAARAQAPEIRAGAHAAVRAFPAHSRRFRASL